MERRIAEKKKDIVQSVIGNCSGSEAIFFLDIKNVAVAAERQLRSALRKDAAVMKVVKARLARIALRESGVSEDTVSSLDKVVSGQVALVFSKQDAQNVAKTICSYQRVFEKDSFVLGGVYKHKVLEIGQVVNISRYPAKPVGLQRLAFALNYPIVGLAKVLKEVADKK